MFRTVIGPGQIEVVVPVLNAERRIDWLIELYAGLGLRPLFIVDERSRDHSASLLRSRGARLRPARGDHARVESLLFNALPAIDSEWVLRFDDDEAPSRALVEWVGRHIPQADGSAVGFSRHWVRFDEETTLQGSSCVRVDGRPFPDWQFRLFRPAAVRLIQEIHTPGFVLERHTFAPDEACFYHLDWIVRSYAERRAKMEKYEAQSPGAGLNFAHFYLPEDRDPAFYATTPVANSEIKSLASRLTYSDVRPLERPLASRMPWSQRQQA